MPRLLTPTTPPANPSACGEQGLTYWLAQACTQAAAQQLAEGRLLGLPTETVYGLAADAGQPDAVRRIFDAKGRPADHPLIVHLPPQWQAGLAHHVPVDTATPPGWATALMQAFWPGPLTLILPRKAGVAEAAAGGQPSVGLRCPAHPAAQAVLQVAQTLGVFGVAAPSANRFGRVSPTTAAHVQSEFPELDDEDLAVLDGGPCQVGIESTIVDATRGQPILLRPGMITIDQLQAVCGCAVLTPEQAAPTLATPAPKASGTLESHYAPRARVRLVPSDQWVATLQRVQQAPDTLGPQGLYHRQSTFSAQWPTDSARWVQRTMPANPALAARELFAVLRELDEAGVSDIWIETPPAGAEWDGVRDRLSRAAA